MNECDKPIQVGATVTITAKVIEIDGEVLVIETENGNAYCADINDAVVN